MLTQTPLSTIIALARAGALDHAWSQFKVSGFESSNDDAAALTVKGRLLKDFGLRAEGDERRHFYLEAADCYRRSASLRPGTYPLINAATLTLLSGDFEQAREIAGEVLDRIAREPDEPETPYWHAATEAEAFLLLGRLDEAREALERAVAAAPQAWEDHASTLRQFLVIHEALGLDGAWVDMLRPPRSLHFADGRPGAAAVDEIIPDALDPEVGFGFGSLAAGAEIVAAETLLERGGQLHVILPSDAESFAAAFVDPHGADWRQRFDAALGAAESVRYVRPLHRPPDDATIALAYRIAHGAALLNAERLMGQALSSRPRANGSGGGVALLAIRVGESEADDFEDRLGEARLALDEAGPAALAAFLNGETILVGYPDPAGAARAARTLHARLRDRFPLQVAGHYGLIDCVRDPFSGTSRPAGSGADIVQAIADATPHGSICVSDDFAAVLAATAGRATDANWIGEINAFDGGSAIGLYALRPGPGLIGPAPRAGAARRRRALRRRDE